MSYILNRCVSCLRYIEIGPPNQPDPSTTCWRCRNQPLEWCKDIRKVMKATQKDKLPMINLQEFYYVEAQTGTIYKIFQNPDGYTSKKVFSYSNVGAEQLDIKSLLLQVARAVHCYFFPKASEDTCFFYSYDLALAGLKKLMIVQRDSEIELVKLKYNKLIGFSESEES